MRRAFLICAFSATTAWAVGIGGVGDRAARAQDAGPERASVRTRVERAPDGSMRRGGVDVPSWVALAGGVTVALVAAGVLAARIGRRRR